MTQPSYDVLLVCSSGGHLAQLLALESWYASKNAVGHLRHR